jgi:hypothetical protein
MGGTSDLVCVAVALVMVVLIMYFLFMGENFIPYQMDQIAQLSKDPISFKYYGRVNDRWGYSPKEYYLNNRMLFPHKDEDSLFDDRITWTNTLLYYPSSSLAIDEIKARPRSQYSYFTADESPPVVAEYRMLNGE